MLLFLYFVGKDFLIFEEYLMFLEKVNIGGVRLLIVCLFVYIVV